MANFQGTSGKDTYNGTADADTIYGYGDNDTLGGGGGNDLIDGGAGEDALSGGAGNDTIYSIEGADTLVDGGIGDDTIWIGSRSGAISTFRPNVLIGGTGRDTIAMYGTATFLMPNFDAVAAGFENFSNAGYAINGSNDANRLNFAGLTTDSSYGAIVYGLAGNDVLGGTLGNDIFYGGDDQDTLNGNAGNDTLAGENGADTINGGAGLDTITGGDGDDMIDGGDDNDNINGGVGDDTITGGAGDDVIDGASGNDSVSGGDGNDQLYAIDGTEVLVDGGKGDDIVYLGSRSAATVTIKPGVLSGGLGTDTLYLFGTTYLSTGAFNPTEAGFEVLTNPGYSIYGTAGVNRFDFSGIATNSTYGAILYGLDGEDVLTGGGGVDILYGGNDADTLTGNGGADSLFGEGGEDKIFGGAGGDTIQGGEANDTIDGGADGDNLTGQSGNDTITGGDGNDSIDGGDGNDSVSGGDGNDTISATDGTETKIDGGAGDDIVYLGSRSAATVTLKPGVLTGGDGTDTLYLFGTTYIAATNFTLADTGFEVLTNPGYTIYATNEANRFNFGGVTVNSTYGVIVYGLDGADVIGGTAGTDVMYGGNDGDTLNGNGGADSLFGEGGADVINGGDGGDTIQGGDANDTIDGGADGDNLTGQSGDDTIVGGDGNDTIDGSDGADSIAGGDGNDTLSATDGTETMIAGGLGDDIIYLGSRSAATVTLKAGVLTGGLGTDTLYVFGTTYLAMNAFTLADTGIEVLTNPGYSFYGTTAGNVFDFSGVTTNSTYGVILYGLEGADVVTGTGGTDVFYGGADNDVIDGGAGSDSLFGEGGEDMLTGGAGGDTLQGGEANDTLDGGADDDNLNGGSGNDTIVGGSGNDTLDGVDGNDSISGGDGNDTLSANDGAERLIDGGSGDDIVYLGSRSAATVTIGQGALQGGSGTDTLYIFGTSYFTGRFVASEAGFEVLTNPGYVINGSAGEETLDFSGLTTNSSYGALLYGLGGNDSLVGTAANDQLYGGDNADVIEGGGGTDYLDGGAGIDRASYACAASAVTVNLSNTAQQDTGGAGLDTLTGFEGLIGSRFNDVLTGDGNANTLTGGAGRDRLIGGDGIDVLEGGSGNDALDGGAARDVAVYDTAWVNLAVTAQGSGYEVSDLRVDAPEGTDTLAGIEQLRFTNGTFAIADTINVGPQGVADAAAVKEAGAAGPGTGIVTGNLLSNDTDANLATVGLGEYLAVSAAGAADGPPQPIAGVGATEIAGLYGTLTINADGSYSYDLANGKASVQALREGETTVDRFSYLLVDAHGASSTATLEVTVTGASDTLARPDLLQVTIGAASALDAAVLLANDALREGTTITGISNVTGASVALVDGMLVITADGATGGFDYTITADDGESSTGHVDLAGVTYRGAAMLTADPAAAAVDFVGAGKADTLTGGSGADHLVGNRGADKLDGGTGIDRLEGGIGGDRYFVDDAGDVVIELSGGGRDSVVSSAAAYTLSANVENLSYNGVGSFAGTGNNLDNTIAGGSGNDTLLGAAGDDVLTGGTGDDTLNGNAGSDTASYADLAAGVSVDLRVAGPQRTGAGGIDTLLSIENLIGSKSVDTLNGSDQGNVIHGGNNRDTLNGNGGNDTLFGDLGADVLTGGNGADRFAYTLIDDFGPLDRPDAITDFSNAQGDIIDLSAIDPDAAAEGDQAFTFIGDAAFTVGSAAFELRYVDNADGTFTLQGDVNHDGVADLALLVTSATAPVESDFAL